MSGLPISRIAGLTETLHFDDATNTFTIKREDDVEPVIDANKRAQNDGDGFSPSRELRHVARIPHVVYQEWCRVHGVDVLKVEHRGLLKRLLNDPDNDFLRTGTGDV